MPNQIEGKTFMFTGTLSLPRHEAQHIVEELGGISSSSLSKDTDYLVVGEDQAGKSNKFIRAGFLGVTRVDEEYFWDIVKEARATLEAEEDYSGLKGIITEEVLVNVLKLLNEKVKLIAIEREYPPIESMSYYNEGNLKKWLDSKFIKLEKRECPYCHYDIPYSINPCHWYCFKCRLFSSIGQEKGRHSCVDWFKLDIDTELGFYKKCKVCGNVKFVAYAEVEEKDKIDARCNYGHSVEFAAEVASKHAHIDERVDITAKHSDKDREKLYSQFERIMRNQSSTS